MKHSYNFINLTGKIYGRWKVLKIYKSGKHARWLCKCKCGKIKDVDGGSLSNGTSISCGCFRKEFLSKNHRTHGLSKTKFFWTWSHILYRCNNPKDKRYSQYGGRGIKCLWKSFEEFRDDMYESYLKHLKKFGGGQQTTIDRINVNGNYCKGNCRWATNKEQCRNTRTNHLIIYNGQTKCLSEWAEIFGLKRQTLHRRIKYSNWPIEKALTTLIK